MDGGATTTRRVIAGDFDQSRDLDILVIRDGAPNVVWLNDRLWAWKQDPRFTLIESRDIDDADVTDLNSDGQLDIVTRSAGGFHQWSMASDGRIQPDLIALQEVPDRARSMFQLVDFNGDGQHEILTADGGQPAVLFADVNDDGSRSWREQFVAAAPSLLPDAARMPAGDGETPDDVQRPVTFAPLMIGDPANGLSLAVMYGAMAESPMVYTPGPGRFDFVVIDFAGREDATSSQRSNASAFGVRYSVRRGATWFSDQRLKPTSGPGQSAIAEVIGLGGMERLDFVAIDWPDGVFQTEVSGVGPTGVIDDDGAERFAAGDRITVSEEQRQLSSCPVIFAWDGERMQFVSDCLGVGGLGFLVEPGVYAPPRPRERFLFPDNSLVADASGHLRLALHEPMEEVCYLDHAAMTLIDMEEGFELLVDERMDTAPPAATGDFLIARTSDVIHPARVVNDRGDDVTSSVRTLDHVAAPAPPIDRRFIGRLAHDHVLTLEFADPIDINAWTAGIPSGHPRLVIDGWVEYPYSQTNFAAWQADASYVAPRIEARDTAGNWTEVVADAGYPAGMPRQMTIELPKDELPVSVTALRLTTNIELYFDRIRLAAATPLRFAPSEAAVTIDDAPLAEAKLRRTGFPRRLHHPQHRPEYDYHDRMPYADMKTPSGAYTAFGDVVPLVAGIDDAVAVFGPGEEVSLRFDVNDASVITAGRRRFFVLDVNGWCKDLDLMTADGDGVDPLPRRDPERALPAGAAELNEQTRTRVRVGRF